MGMRAARWRDRFGLDSTSTSFKQGGEAFERFRLKWNAMFKEHFCEPEPPVLLVTVLQLRLGKMTSPCRATTVVRRCQVKQRRQPLLKLYFCPATFNRMADTFNSIDSLR